MTQLVGKIIEDIYNGKPKNLKEDLNKVISEKVLDVLESKKVAVAKKFFLGKE